ncbi:protein phosphatase 1L-like [Tubulanus polymorphus]|uniref:protein phosphatase 1L-like n=1 Tax=Tubulanus polymorphus TaxID=672921 RepID=UPI003DA3594D
MSLVHASIRWIRRYLLSSQSLLTLLTIIVIYALFRQRSTFWSTIKKLRSKLRFSSTSSASSTDADDSADLTRKTKASWELRKGNVGMYAIQGRRATMEDRFNVVTADQLEHTGTSIYGIFDGHGGQFAADFVEKTLFKTIMVRLLKSALNGGPDNFSKLLTDEILYVDKQLLSVEKLTNEASGTTALVMLLRNGILTVANVGDSRAVLYTDDDKLMPLSFDHKPHQLKERKRIKDAGGFISFNGVWRVAGVLATSRALGDYPLKDKNLIIADPDILTFDLNEIKPQFMILATDGLWDMFSNEEAVAYIRERLDEPHFGAKSIVLQAYYRGSLDNITVIVVNFLANQASVVRRGSTA